MADYTRGTGAGGVMLIRDTGWEVQFHIQAGDSSTWANGIPWSWQANGGSGSGQFSYSRGRPWVHVGTVTASYTQDVRFSIGRSGTSGLGGPTDFWQRIERKPPEPEQPQISLPGPPTPLGIQNIGHTTMRYHFRGTTDGGSPILEWGITYGRDPYIGEYYPGWQTGESNVRDLHLGTRYYFWSRGRNILGWGPWSARIDARTLAGARVNRNGNWTEDIPYVNQNGTWKQAIPFVNQNGVWKDAR